MRWRRHRHQAADAAEVDRIRGLYDALGLGFPAEALRVFTGGDGQSRESWCLSHMGRMVRCLRAPDLSDRELFALPATWEVIRVATRFVTSRHRRDVDEIHVSGTLYCRPRGTWERIPLPFQHTWTMRAGKALRFENLMDATVLRLEQAEPVPGQ